MTSFRIPVLEGRGRERDASGVGRLIDVTLSERCHPWILAVVIGLVALAARLISIDRAYDTFIDEITYTQVALNIAHGQGTTLYGSAFDLQPPAVLGLLAAIIDVGAVHGSLEHVILTLRPVAAAFGALECVGTFLLVRRSVATRYAVAAAALMILNPLVASYDGIVMLEPFAQAAAVATVGLLAASISSRTLHGEHRRHRRHRGARRYALAAGLFGGIVVTTKETFGLVLVISMLVVLVTGWIGHRRRIAAAVAGTVASYGVYLVALGATSGLGPWWSAKVTGLNRILGAYQPTGFNSPETHVSLLSRAAADVGQYGVSYLLLASGSLAGAWLVLRPRPWRAEWRVGASDRQRVALLVGVWAVVAAAYLSFETLFGSIEEQMYYILALPSTAAVVIAVSQVDRRAWRRAAAVALAACLLFDAVAWRATHTGDHNSDERLLAWAGQHLPPDSVVSADDGSTQFLLEDQRVGVWTTIPQLSAHHVDYVIIDTSLVAQGYAPVSLAFERTLDRDATIIWQSSETGGGSLRVYDVEDLDGV